MTNDDRDYARALRAQFEEEDRLHAEKLASGELRPLMMSGDAFTALVDSDGADWRVVIRKDKDGNTLPEPVTRYYSTMNRADNGALNVSQKLRQEFGITGTYSIY
jgi:hypothetical protein